MCHMAEISKTLKKQWISLIFSMFWGGHGLCLGASGGHVGPSWLQGDGLVAILAPSWGILEPS